jgi:hypothetical protein
MDERSHRIAKRFERPLLVAAVLTIPVTILQLLPAADPWRTIADVLSYLDRVLGGDSGHAQCGAVQASVAA